MELKIIGSGSAGNCYVLKNDSEALVIECGMNIKDIKQAINFNIAKVVGCIITHEHKDHCKSVQQVIDAGIDVYASKGTLEAMGVVGSHRSNAIASKQLFKVGDFSIMPFDVHHDAAEPIGFVINHPETGNVLFLTDTFYTAYTFKGLNNIIIEANYSRKIINEKLGPESGKEFLRNRILKSHLSLENCLEALSKNDLTKVNNIVLIHLSDSNSNEKQFMEAVVLATGKNVTVASNGITIPFNKTPF